MTLPNIELMLKELEGRLAHMGAEERELAVQVAGDMAEVATRQAMGDDVTELQTHLQAQVLNLNAALVEEIGNYVADFIAGAFRMSIQILVANR